MALEDFYSNLVFILRWFHILAGITWIGHLYFFNFVNASFQSKLEKDYKKVVNPQLMPRALWWFRWGAMFTLIFGLAMFFVKYMGNTNLLKDADGMLTGRAIWIMIGMTLGLIMWFNVWFIIWPAQKNLIAWTRDGVSPPEQPALAKRAGLFSKINTYLSGPMLFCMIAPNNYGAFSVGTFVIVSVIALATIWGLYKIAPKVGTSI